MRIKRIKSGSTIQGDGKEPTVVRNCNFEEVCLKFGKEYW